MLVPDYSNRDYWKATTPYGLNDATYKIDLGKTLLELAGREITHIPWNVLSREFLKQCYRPNWTATSGSLSN